MSYFCIGLCALSFGLWRHVRITIPQCYAQWGTAELVVEFHKENARFPKGWDELRPLWDEGVAIHAATEDFDVLTSLVAIEFERLPELATGPFERGQQPEVIYPVSGASAYWAGAEPNCLVSERVSATP